MPDSQECNVPQFSKNELYESCVNMFRNIYLNEQCESDSYFLAKWEAHRNYVKVSNVARCTNVSKYEQIRAELRNSFNEGREAEQYK